MPDMDVTIPLAICLALQTLVALEGLAAEPEQPSRPHLTISRTDTARSDRIFQVELELTGKGEDIRRTQKSMLAITDGTAIRIGGLWSVAAREGTETQQDFADRIGIRSVSRCKVEMAVTVEARRSGKTPDGVRRVYKVELTAVKTVRLGQRFSLDLGKDADSGMSYAIEAIVQEDRSEK
jgi:hypothetical protein